MPRSIARLKAADAVLLGRTNMDEFAMGGSTENSAFQKTAQSLGSRSARRADRAAESAACVAARHGAALDRHRYRRLDPPAGRPVRRHGAEADVRPRQPLRAGGVCQQPGSDRSVGPHGRRCGAAAGSAWPATIRSIPPRSIGPCRSVIADRRPAAHGSDAGPGARAFWPGLDAEVEAAVREAVRVYESLGAKVKEISLPHSKYGVAAYYIIAPCEASSNLARYDGVHYGHRTDEAQMHAELAAERTALEAAGDQADIEKLDNPLVRHVPPQPGRRFWRRRSSAGSCSAPTP